MSRGLLAVVAVGMMVCVAGTTWGQERGEPGERGQRGGEWRERMQAGERPPMGEGRGGAWDPEQMRARMTERLKEQLGATDEEWEVLGPRVERVQTLQRQAAQGALGGMAAGMLRGGGRGDGGRDPRFARPGEEAGEVAQRTQALRQLLDNESATSEQIREGLSNLRAAREKTQSELKAAQAELRELVTQRQEAMLVMMGLLD
jgi:hypothetical protein